MSEKKKNDGLGVAGLLLVGFILLKVAGVIAWSWWWVLSPLWIGALLAILLFILGDGTDE